MSQRVNRVATVAVVADVDRRQDALRRELPDHALGHAQEFGRAGCVDGDWVRPQLAHHDDLAELIPFGVISMTSGP